AHRADLLHPGLRQAHRGLGVQSRLRGGAGRRAGDGDRLHPAQSHRRYRLRAGQSAAARLIVADAAFNAAMVEAADEPVASLARREGAMLGLAVILLFVLLAVLAPLIAPYDPTAQSWTAVRKPPTLAHPFGTDDVGRDILARIIFGARASLLAGVISVAIALS